MFLIYKYNRYILLALITDKNITEFAANIISLHVVFVFFGWHSSYQFAAFLADNQLLDKENIVFVFFICSRHFLPTGSVSRTTSSRSSSSDLLAAFLADRWRQDKNDGALPEPLPDGGLHLLVVKGLQLLLAGAAL